MVPGPVRVPRKIFEAYQVDYGSADIEPEFLELYNHTEENLKKVIQTGSKVVIHTGEGMITLWGALKSCILPGDRVLAVGTGVFGFGIGDMARSIGADVFTVSFGYDETIHDWDLVEKAIAEFQPKMITAVHCETPSGTLNPIGPLGMLKEKYQVPLFYLDAVASLGGAPVLTDEWKVDLLLGGSQKCLSVPPGMSFLSVSENAWRVIEQVNYPGYDALLPFQTAQKNFNFPYTPYWHGMASLNTGVEMLLAEGLENCFKRHADVAEYCRKQLVEIGYKLFPAAEAIPSPTVTAVKVPDGISWEQFDAVLRKHGMAVGGSFGPLSGKVFRLGHMGSQADLDLVKQALEVLQFVKH
jgi:aspartate aminotransferase-like enzyme